MNGTHLMKRIAILSVVSILAACGSESGAFENERWGEAESIDPTEDFTAGSAPRSSTSSTESTEGTEGVQASTATNDGTGDPDRTELGDAAFAQTGFTVLRGCFSSENDCELAVIQAFFIQLENCACLFATTQGCDFDHPLGVLCEP